MRSSANVDVLETRRRTRDQTSWGAVNDNAEESASTRMRLSEEDVRRRLAAALLPREVPTLPPTLLPTIRPTLQGTVSIDHVITDPINASTD